MQERVKFFSTSDLASGYMLDRASKKLDKFQPGRTRYNVNEILELYNILKFVKAEVYLDHWTDAYRAQFLSYKSDLFKTINRYIGSLNTKNFSSKTKNIEDQYNEDFLELYSYNKLNTKISERQFSNLVSSNLISLRTLLNN